jgi:hypothetical protein
MSTRKIEVKWTLRQNMWKVSTNIFNTITESCVITCPGYHSREMCSNEVDSLNLSSNNKNGNKYIKDISVGDYAIIFASGHKSPLCVQITSEAYRKEINEITIYKKFGHKNKYNTEEVEVCLTGQNTRKFTHTEIMVAYVRDVKIIGILNYDQYYDIINKYKYTQTTIAKNKSQLRFINV